MVCSITGHSKATIHQLTTRLVTSKNVLFPGRNCLLATSTDDPLLCWWLGDNQNVGSLDQLLTGGYDLEDNIIEVAIMVVTWWIVGCFCTVIIVTGAWHVMAPSRVTNMLFWLYCSPNAHLQLEAVSSRYCYLDFPNCLPHFNNIGWATWAFRNIVSLWVTMQWFSILDVVRSSVVYFWSR